MTALVELIKTVNNKILEGKLMESPTWATSKTEQGNPTGIGHLGEQMKNCYADLEKILKHYGCTFDDVIAENIFTTNMLLFLENAAYRYTIYTKQFPTGSWLGVKKLALPELMIEIELEVYKPE